MAICGAVHSLVFAAGCLVVLASAVRPVGFELQSAANAVQGSARGSRAESGALDQQHAVSVSQNETDDKSAQPGTTGDCDVGTGANDCMTGEGKFFIKKGDQGEDRLFKVMKDKGDDVWVFWLQDKGKDDAPLVNAKGVRPPWLVREGKEVTLFFQIELGDAPNPAPSSSFAQQHGTSVSGSKVSGPGANGERNEFIEVECYQNGKGEWFDGVLKEYGKAEEDGRAKFEQCQDNDQFTKFEQKVEQNLKGEEEEAQGGDKEQSTSSGDKGEDKTETHTSEGSGENSTEKPSGEESGI